MRLGISGWSNKLRGLKGSVILSLRSLTEVEALSVRFGDRKGVAVTGAPRSPYSNRVYTHWVIYI